MARSNARFLVVLSWTAVVLASASCSSRQSEDEFGQIARPLPSGDNADQWTTPDAGPHVDGECVSNVTGRVRFPNGIEPVPDAFVYVIDPYAPIYEHTCGQCFDPGQVENYTRTTIDGAFELPVYSDGAKKLVIEKGAFRRIVPLDLSCNQNVALSEPSTRLPRDHEEGRIPRIAVATGIFDAMQNVLAKMGLARMDTAGVVIGTEQYDLFGGTDTGAYPPFTALLLDIDRMRDYDVIYINCGSLPEEQITSIVQNAVVRQNLRAYVHDGGRLYVTDEAYDYVEQVFPEFIAFQGSDSGLSTTPEREDAAEIGADASITYATLHDDTLSSWLSQQGMLTSEGYAPIVGMLRGWTVMKEIDDRRATVWTSAPVNWFENGVAMHGDRPLTVTFNYGCGRVLFTSYHTSPRSFSGDATRATLTGQELILSYLTLEIGTCVQEGDLW